VLGGGAKSQQQQQRQQRGAGGSCFRGGAPPCPGIATRFGRPSLAALTAVGHPWPILRNTRTGRRRVAVGAAALLTVRHLGGDRQVPVIPTKVGPFVVGAT